MGYMYYAPVDRYADVLGTADRVLAYGDARPADWPEALRGVTPSWLTDLL